MYCTKCGQKNENETLYCPTCGTATRQQGLTHPPTRKVAADFSSSICYAGFWFRALALFIDVIFSTIMTIIIVLPLAFSFGLSMADSATTKELEVMGEAMGNVLGWIVSWLYFTISESSRWQATPGKKLLGLRVTDLNGGRIGFGKANGRYWAQILSVITLLIGYIMAAFTAKKQALHDMMAGTLVVRG